MFLRTTKANTAHGPVEYIQLCHNYRDKESGRSKTNVLYNFGRADNLDLDALRRLVKSISKFLPEEEAAVIQGELGFESPMKYMGSRQLGGCWFLDAMWSRMGIDSVLHGLLSKRSYTTPVERLIFAMVANRALAPSSKLHIEHWVANEAYITSLPEVEVQQLYRAMDFLLEAADEVQHEIFFSVANLFNLDVDLLFLDTTTTYFEIEGEDADVIDDTGESSVGLRKRGYSKDSRSDLAQGLIAFAVTRTGIPVRCWVWPGNTSDQEIVEQVKTDLNGWNLGRVVYVEDTGFNSERNRRILQGAGGQYIIGEKLRNGPRAELNEALSFGGRYLKLDNGLEIKEVIVGADSAVARRFVIVRNPEEVERDRLKRDEIVKETERRLEALKQLEGEPHNKAACALRSHAVYGRYIRQAKNGKLFINKSQIRADAAVDGKYLISTSDERMSAEDVVMGYKQLAEIERVFKDLKHLIEIRPVRHRLPERIQAHVLLCWMAILLIRVAENETGKTWFQMRKLLSTLTVGIHGTNSGLIFQSNPPTEEQEALLKTLKLQLPPRYLSISAPETGHKT